MRRSSSIPRAMQATIPTPSPSRSRSSSTLRPASILGAQAVGYEGVDKRIDVIAAFLSMGANIEALDRVRACLCSALREREGPRELRGLRGREYPGGLTAQVRWNEVARLKAEGAFILDVRTPEEFALGHIEGAANISNTDPAPRLAEVPRDRFVLLYCGVGIRGYLAERILRQNGWTRPGQSRRRLEDLRGGDGRAIEQGHLPSGRARVR